MEGAGLIRQFTSWSRDLKFNSSLFQTGLNYRGGRGHSFSVTPCFKPHQRAAEHQSRPANHNLSSLGSGF